MTEALSRPALASPWALRTMGVSWEVTGAWCAGPRGRPTAPDGTHEVAQSVARDCRIVCVDNDPLVLVYARALLTSAHEVTCGCLRKARRALPGPYGTP
jgi:S-adenosyl methyltransferase